jgi:hypothetical protein
MHLNIMARDRSSRVMHALKAGTAYFALVFGSICYPLLGVFAAVPWLFWKYRKHESAEA